MVGWGCDSVVEHLLMMGKVLGSLSSIAQKKKKKKKVLSDEIRWYSHRHKRCYQDTPQRQVVKMEEMRVEIQDISPYKCFKGFLHWVSQVPPESGL